jgi:glucose/arabinose dehydrogenase
MGMRACVLTGLFGIGCAVQAMASAGLTLEPVVTGLNQPLYLTSPPGDSRLFILEQGGAVRIVQDGALLPTPFLQVPTAASGERGLLGLAFHPGYATNGLFYVNYTNASGATVVAEYSVSAVPNVANAASGRTLLSFAQPGSNHNGGWMSFGPDGYLYIASGDGGGANDPGNNAQNTSNKLGAMLRIDVNGNDFPEDPSRNYAVPPTNPFVGQAGDDTIWAYGLRNPWRNSFDRLTGDLVIGDVGQNAREEINFQPAGSSGGQNYGWRVREGFIQNPAFPDAPVPPDAVDPIFDYPHEPGRRKSVTGGYVYRGSMIPELYGAYVFGDFVQGEIYSLRYDPATGSVSDVRDLTEQLNPGRVFGSFAISSFGQDMNGELYLVNYGGEVYRIIPEPGSLCLIAIAGLALCRRRTS